MGVAKFLVKRILQGVFVVWGVVTVVFLLRFLTPGDPTRALLPPDVSAERREVLAEQLGLHLPLPVQYAHYLGDLVRLDLGESFRTGVPVSDLILHRLGPTIELTIAATIVAVIIAIPLGVISARRRHKPADYGATLFSLVGISTPNFWLGVMLIIFVAVQVDVLPTGGRSVAFGDAWGTFFSNGDLSLVGRWLAQLVLPAIALGTYFTALLTRLTRSGMLDELGKPYTKALDAKGLPSVLVLYKHVLRNTLIPIITVLGLQVGTLIGGAIITETVFAWPGLGTLLIRGITQRDWMVIQGVIIVIGVGFVIINIIVDAMYSYFDPRVSVE